MVKSNVKRKLLNSVNFEWDVFLAYSCTSCNIVVGVINIFFSSKLNVFVETQKIFKSFESLKGSLETNTK
jgi:hypothetical protein